jgi:hypothetical protein
MESDKRQTLNALVGEQVLHALGEPRNQLKVQVRPLWDGNYRVNVLVGADATNAKIPPATSSRRTPTGTSSTRARRSTNTISPFRRTYAVTDACPRS